MEGGERSWAERRFRLQQGLTTSGAVDSVAEPPMRQAGFTPVPHKDSGGASMCHFRTVAALVIAAPLLATAGCQNVFRPAPVMLPPPVAPIQVAPAYLFGDIIGGHAA